MANHQNIHYDYRKAFFFQFSINICNGDIMTDIALIGERNFLYEKLFQELGVTYQFLHASILGSPFLPQFKMIMIPTGFANPQYSDTLASLERLKSRLAEFVGKGGILTVFGPLVQEHNYEWLPIPLKYIGEYGPRDVQASEHESACPCDMLRPECDGYLVPGEGFKAVLEDDKDRPIIVAANYGSGLIVATSVHEFPAAEYIQWALNKAKPASI